MRACPGPAGRWRRGGSARLVRGVGGDLPVDHREIGLQLVELRRDPVPMPAQQLDPAGAVAVGAGPFDERPDVLDRHPGATQPDDDIEEAEGELVEDAVAAGGAGQLAQQPAAVVEPERLDRDAGLLGHLADGETDRGARGGVRVGHALHCATWSGLQVKPSSADLLRSDPPGYSWPMPAPRITTPIRPIRRAVTRRPCSSSHSWARTSRGCISSGMAIVEMIGMATVLAEMTT